MRKKIVLIVLCILAIIVVICGIIALVNRNVRSIYPDLSENSIAFKIIEYIDKNDDDAGYGMIEYNGRKYMPYGTLKGIINNTDIDKCIGYVIQDENNTSMPDKNNKDERIYTLTVDKENNFLMEYYIGKTLMNQPSFYRAVDTKETNITIPEYIDSLEYNYWNVINGNYNKGDKDFMSEFIIEVNNRELVVRVEDNSSSKELLEKLKEGNIIINASDYNNFEKVGKLGFNLPTNDKQITTKPGDVILYQGNNICLYYNINSWTFTKLGEVTNVDGDELRNILGDSNVTLILKLK